jgi:ATP/maltotriose-dependent transcriptional regulator MalT
MTEALRKFEASQENHSCARASSILAEIEFESGNVEAALASTLRAINLYNAMELPHFTLMPLANVSMYLNALGRSFESLALSHRNIPELVKYGQQIGVVTSLQHSAFALATLGRLGDAARIAGFCDSRFRAAGMERWPGDVPELERFMRLLREQLDTAALKSLLEEGALLEEAAAVDLTMAAAGAMVEGAERDQTPNFEPTT